MPYVLSFRMVFFYLVTTGWIFDIGLCENLISQSRYMTISYTLQLYRHLESEELRDRGGTI